jgi:hypothetical protein
MSEKHDTRPMMFKLAVWYGYGFAGILLLYGSVRIVLSFLDHNYTDLFQPIIFAVAGLVFLAPAVAFKGRRPWGYYSLLGIVVLVIVLSGLGYHQYENLIILALSVVALFALLSSQTKDYLFGRH